MSKQQRLALMPREQFANLSLHEKNDYLQTLAQNFANKPTATINRSTRTR